MQFILATAALALVGRGLGLGWGEAIALGAIFSLSSTALVLKILPDEKEESFPVGKCATEILMFQDIFAILLLVLFDRFALKPLFRFLISFKSDEVITAFALLLVVAAASGLLSRATLSLGVS
jgi:CPA2 family monovalent cation:H+ antiporter-2